MPTIDSQNSEFTDIAAEGPKVIKKRKKGRPVLVLLFVVIVIVALGFVITRVAGNTSISAGSSKDFQAVFLINGQVYFGHVVKETKEVVVVRDIYYLRASEPPLQQKDQEGNLEPQAAANDLSLIKLGNELHGPKDEMRIVRNNVLFIEDLQDDSKVTVAIKDYIQNQK